MAESDSLLGELVRLGLARPSLDVLKDILTKLAERLGGFGATLWQLRYADSTNPEPLTFAQVVANPLIVRLYVLAHGFTDDSYQCAYHDLSLERPTGQAVLHGAYEEADAANSALVDHDSPFVCQAKPGSQYAVRVTFPDGSLGAVSLYRKQAGRFPPETKDALLFLAEHIAALYSAVRDRVAYKLVNDVAGIVADTAAGKDQVNAHLMEVCTLISVALGCFETTIYLEDRLLQRGIYEVSATTNPAALRQQKYIETDSGITPCVIRVRKPIFILDTKHIPGKLLELTGWIPWQVSSPSHPVSFAAVPLLTDGKVVGVLRCSAGSTAPYYLAEREVQLLEILASRLASFWSRWMRMRQMERSVAKWKEFAEGIEGLGGHITDLTQKSKSSRTGAKFQKEFYIAALNVAKGSISGADALEFAVADAPRKYIVPIAWVGTVWDRYLKNLPNGGRLRLSNPAVNSWDHVYSTKQIAFIPDTSDPKIPYANVIPETLQVLFAPVIMDTSCIGVVGIRSWGRFEDLEQAITMMQVVAMVIALYHQLTMLLTQQAQVYQDLEHQVRSPIFQAYKRIQSVADDHRRTLANSTELNASDLNAVRGLLGKARRVLSNIRLYEDLASGRTIAAKKESAPIGEVIKMLIEGALDNRILWQHKNINFDVERDSIGRTRLPIPIDATLFEQVISNLMDNAGKYGCPGSAVNIDASHDENRQFRLTVKNRAVEPLLRDELMQLGTRGFRTEAAKRLTAEGIGSGLYLVKLIVEAHGGSFIPSETDPLGDTRISVTFPLK